MNNKPMSMIEHIKFSIRWLLAELAMKHCGCAMIYWVDPYQWDEYIDHGGEELNTIIGNRRGIWQ